MNEGMFNDDYKLKEAMVYYKHVNPTLTEWWERHGAATFAIERFRFIPVAADGRPSHRSFCNNCGHDSVYSFKDNKDFSQCINPDCKLIDCDIKVYNEEIQRREVL